VTLKKPELVSSPAVGAISHEIPGKGLLIDEKEQVIALQQRLTITAEKQERHQYGRSSDRPV
jgi:hypothetical protein